jgi:hypothetical protein
MVTGNNGVRMQWRAGDGQATQLSSGANVNAPVWLKLIKVGNDVAAYYSQDSASWTQVGNIETVGFGTNYLYGMAVTPHNDGRYVTLTTDNITANLPAVGSLTPPPLLAAESVHVGNMKVKASDDGSKWGGVVDVTVHNEKEEELAYATVYVEWTLANTEKARGVTSCTTDGSGRCALLIRNISDNIDRATLKVVDVKYEYGPFLTADSHRGNKPKNGIKVKLKEPQ